MKLPKPLVAAVCAGTLAALASGSAASPAHATATITVTDWEMNEPAGATVMPDSGPNAINGTIGTGLATGAVYHGSTGYQWASLNPTAPPPKPERLVTVDDSRLNPGSGEYAVTIRYRSTHNYGNVLQKGQNATTGGYWKFEQPNGLMTCLFKGSAGQRALKWQTPLNDGEWHVVRCAIDSTGLTMTVDGTSRVLKGPIGTISNTWPLSIGGKSQCDQVKVTCDYFAGGLDYVKIEKG